MHGETGKKKLGWGGNPVKCHDVNFFMCEMYVTMEHDERVHGARQSRIRTVNRERLAAFKKEHLLTKTRRRKVSQRRREDAIRKLLGGSPEVVQFILDEPPIVQPSILSSSLPSPPPPLSLPSSPDGHCSNLLSLPCSPLLSSPSTPLRGVEWECVSYPSSPTSPPRGWLRKILWW